MRYYTREFECLAAVKYTLPFCPFRTTMIQYLSLDLSDEVGEVPIAIQMLLSWNSLRIPMEIMVVYHC